MSEKRNYEQAKLHRAMAWLMVRTIAWSLLMLWALHLACDVRGYLVLAIGLLGGFRAGMWYHSRSLDRLADLSAADRYRKATVMR